MTNKQLLRHLYKAILHSVENRTSMQVSRLDHKSFRYVGFSDSPFANNSDLPTQLEHIVLVVIFKNPFVLISYKSYQACRVVRSAMSGEFISFMVEISVTLTDDLQNILDRLLTDYKSFFGVVSKVFRTSKKRIMLDIAASREEYHGKVISDIVFFRTSNNLDDALTKHMFQASLRQSLFSRQLKNPID